MLCQIADLFVDVPEAGGMAPRCREYLFSQAFPADITLDETLYHYEKYPDYPEQVAYLDSGFQFYRQLIRFDGMMLHASAVSMDDRAYLFSGNCGAGKSTHTRLWQSTFGEAAQVFNDDKPALRRIKGVWYAYGTPWCGKDGINQNRKVPVAGICFLKQADENRIRRLSAQETLRKILAQTSHRFDTADELDLLLHHVEQLVSEIPVFELQNRPEADAARMSYETMRKAAQEAGI